NGSRSCSDIGDAPVDTRPVLLQHGTAERVLLDLEEHRAKARAFQTELESPDPAEQRADGDHRAAPPRSGRTGGGGAHENPSCAGAAIAPRNRASISALKSGRALSMESTPQLLAQATRTPEPMRPTWQRLPCACAASAHGR